MKTTKVLHLCDPIKDAPVKVGTRVRMLVDGVVTSMTPDAVDNTVLEVHGIVLEMATVTVRA